MDLNKINAKYIQVEVVLKLELYGSFQRSFRTSPVAGGLGGWVAGDFENIATQL